MFDFNSASNSGISSFGIDTTCSIFTPPTNNGAQLISMNVNIIFTIYKNMNLKFLSFKYFNLKDLYFAYVEGLNGNIYIF